MDEPPVQAASQDRRTFLTVVGASAVAGVVVAAASQGAAQTPVEQVIDPLELMRRDLARALAKPVDQRRWGMVIDTRKCVACYACVVSCVAENALPPGVMYRKVSIVETGSYPDVGMKFMPSNCQHCDNPPCRDAAPAGSVTKRPDGVVVFHYERLRDPEVARAVAEACPYNAVSYDSGARWTEGTPAAQPYETLNAPEYGRQWRRQGGGLPAGSARKCHFCLHRIEQGHLPACVTTCVGRATYFGDFGDPSSTVARLAASQQGLRLLEGRGTQPRVVYLADDPAECRACHG
jgi:molybdopterin-containing oxidoreductase family iron-sulfur binding subunit